MRRDVLSIVLLTFVIIVSIALLSINNESFAQGNFSDIDESHWAYSYVTELASKGVINGYDDGTFKPSKTISRAEFIKLMVCASIGDEQANNINVDDYKVENDLRDYLDQWYAKYTVWATKNNLMSSGYMKEDMSAPIKRNEVANILYNFCLRDGLIDEEISGEEEAIVLYQSGDVQENADYIEVYSKEYIASLPWYDEETSELTLDEYYELMNLPSNTSQKASNYNYYFNDIVNESYSTQVGINRITYKGLIKGYDDKTYKPLNEITRAEIATIISRYLSMIKE